MAAYLTVEEYLARFGNAEALRLTNETPQAPAIVPEKIERAIADAGELAEGYVAKRYPLPIADPPRLLIGIVAALAREALHKTNPTEEVRNAADRARAQLRDVSIGRLDLLIDDGAPLPSTERLAITSGDAAPATFTREKMANFTSFGGAPVAHWRR